MWKEASLVEFVLTLLSFQLFIERKNLVRFSMAIGNGELMHECCAKHWLTGTARMKQYTETDEDGEKRGVSMESKEGTKKKSQRPITA